MYQKDLNFLDNSKTDFQDFENQNPTPKNNRKKIIIWAIFLLILAVFITTKITNGKNNDYLEYDPVTLEPQEPEGFLKKITYLIFNRNAKLEGSKTDRINILLLGQGGLGHEGPYLTDTIMILSYRPSDQDIALISIPRDLGVNIPDYGLTKINHANHVGEMEKPNMGAALATKVISETLDLDIPYYIRIDFKAFTEIIDAVGGVRVNVEKDFTDTEYPADDFQYQTVSFKAGPQTMDGNTALKYARSRHGDNGEGSDFARAKRQQKLILALKEKVLSFSTLTNPVKIKKMLDSLTENMVTNMNFDEILEFIKIAKDLNTSEIHNLVLDDSPTGFLTSTIAENGAFLLLPKTGNWSETQNAIKNIFNEENLNSIQNQNIETVETKEEEPIKLNEKNDIIIEIQNGTWQTGLAAQTKQKLTDKNFYVETIGNTNPDYKPVKQSAVYFLNKNISDEIQEEIKETLNFKTFTKIDDETILPTNDVDILIIIGDDYLN